MSVSVDEVVEHIREHGCYVHEHAIEQSMCDELLGEIHRLEEAGVPRSLDSDFHGHRTTRFYDVLNLGDVWQQLPVHPAILPVATGVLGDDCLLNTYGTSIVNPGDQRTSCSVRPSIGQNLFR